MKRKSSLSEFNSDTALHFEHFRCAGPNLTLVLFVCFNLRSELFFILKTYNCYHEGRSFQLRLREVCANPDTGSGVCLVCKNVRSVSEVFKQPQWCWQSYKRYRTKENLGPLRWKFIVMYCTMCHCNWLMITFLWNMKIFLLVSYSRIYL